MFNLKFFTDNAAFGDGFDSQEIQRILGELSIYIETNDFSNEGFQIAIRDINGNVIGNCKYTYEMEG